MHLLTGPQNGHYERHTSISRTELRANMVLVLFEDVEEFLKAVKVLKDFEAWLLSEKIPLT